MMKDKPANYIWLVTLIIRCTPYWILLWLCLLQYYYLYEKSSQFNQEAILTAYFYSNNWCLDIKYIDSSCLMFQERKTPHTKSIPKHENAP